MARAGLSADAVVAAAAALADREGLEAVTLARLAADAGVRPPSLYAHVDGLGDLRRRLAIRGARELAAALREAATGAQLPSARTTTIVRLTGVPGWTLPSPGSARMSERLSFSSTK